MKPWSQKEVMATLTDYFSMLQCELLGRPYSKTAHRKKLLKKLDRRSASAIERKHQTISSVLLEIGLPYIDGYKPLDNYQTMLPGAIETYFQTEPEILSILLSYAESTISLPVQRALFLPDVLVPPPGRPVMKRAKKRDALKRMARKYDFASREAKNTSLKAAGEKFVLDFETGRLRKEGRTDLAAQIEWTARGKNNRSWYDIRSFEADGTERYITVKTTNCGLKFPFVLSGAELAFSKEQPNQYYLYRVFNFLKSPKLYMLKGRLHPHVKLTPIVFQTQIAS